MTKEQLGFTVWFTGVPASGKSTIGRKVERHLESLGLKVENLDADEVRAAISPNLGYTEEARDENTKRLAYVGKLLSRNGVAVIITAVSSRRRFRDRAREMNPHFVEVHVKAPLEELKRRDPKGLYARAEKGEVSDIAGMHQPYEAPEDPEVVCDTSEESVEESARRVVRYLEDAGYIPKTLPDADSDEYTEADEAQIKQRLENLGYL